MVTGGVLLTAAVYLNGKGRIAGVLETLNVVGATETLGRGRGTRRAAGVICPHCIPRCVHARIYCALQFCWDVDRRCSDIDRHLDLDLTSRLMQVLDPPTFQVVSLYFPVVYLLDTCG